MEVTHKPVFKSAEPTWAQVQRVIVSVSAMRQVVISRLFLSEVEISPEEVGVEAKSIYVLSPPPHRKEMIW